MSTRKHLTKALLWPKLAHKHKKLLYGALILVCILLTFVSIVFYKSTRNPKTTIPAGIEIPIVEEIPEPPRPVLPHYVEIMSGCNWAFEGTCLNLRSGPSLESPVLLRLRTGMVLRVEPTPIYRDGYDWYKVIFDKRISYPERITGDWYVAGVAGKVRVFEDVGDLDYTKETPPTNKRIVVDISDQTLRAYDGNTLFMQELISTGAGITATTTGKFTIFRKTPSRYMQGPLPGAPADQYYDLPGVSWDLYYSADGSVIHGVYWHNNFGQQMSHGCINQSPENARKLYQWADLGTKVIVEN